MARQSAQCYYLPMKQHRVCPWWLGYLLASPLASLLENPNEVVKRYVGEGMTVLEPGPGMGSSRCRWLAWWDLVAVS